MKVIWSENQKLHQPKYEWNFGEKVKYPETPDREIEILNHLKNKGYEKYLINARDFPLEHILAVHDNEMVRHFQQCENDLGDDEAVYPHIFPYRHFDPFSRINYRKAGYFCFDVGTEIDKHTFTAAKASADVALTGADLLVCGDERRAFSLCRPPGHHADRENYGGYCYFNNVAIAAQYIFSKTGGRVAILDSDFHHGNGTQGIFYDCPHVFYISIHGDPKINYPYFSGFAEEEGKGIGHGTTWNIPLPPGTTDGEYREHVKTVLKKVVEWGADYFIASLGFDPFKDDPSGNFKISREFFGELGAMYGKLDMPVLTCLEGGYDVQDIGENAVAYFEGFLGK
jgi:acetoin utilization deacetylase AcuC-like enzyme